MVDEALRDLPTMMRQVMNGTMPYPLPVYDERPGKQVASTREQRIEQHMSKVRKIELMRNKGAASTNDSIQKPQQSVNVKDIKYLQPISISELEVSRVSYRGRVLYCTILTPCFVINAATTLVEDTNGDIANISVYNLQKAKQILRAGCKIAIIEPFYKMRADGTPGIRVDEPKEIKYDVEVPLQVYVGSADSSSQDMTENTVTENIGVEMSCGNYASAAPEIPERRPDMHRVAIGKDAMRYREKGNLASKDLKFDEAERHYTSAIEATGAATLVKDSDTGEGFDLWTLYSNRALSRIKLGKPHLALRDALMSHRCAPANAFKPVLRCAQALAALGYHTESSDALTDAQVTFPQHSKLFQDLEKQLKPKATLRVGLSQEFKSIAAALRSAPVDAEILVDPGVYTEPLLIDKPVTIRSTGKDPEDLTPIDVEAVKGLSEIRVGWTNAVNVQLRSRLSGSVRLFGFRIICTAPLQQSMNAILVCGSVVIVRNCEMSAASGPVVAACDGGRFIAENSSVYDGAQGGILVDGRYSELVLRKVQVCYNAANGVEIRRGGSASLEACSIFANGRQGLLVWNQAGAFEAQRCEIHSHNAESGINVAENKPNEARFVECKIYSNDYAGLAVESKGNARLVDCKISSNCEGVLIQQSGCAVVERCEVFSNRANGIFVGYDHVGTAEILDNRVHENRFKGILIGNDRGKKYLRVEGNTEQRNYGLPPGMPSSVSKQQCMNSADLRKWAKRVKKHGGTDASPVLKAMPNSRFEEVFDSVRSKSGIMRVDAILGCTFCGKNPEAVSKKLQKCSKCRSVWYCSKECQAKHWKGGHKAMCSFPKAKHPAFIDPYTSI